MTIFTAMLILVLSDSTASGRISSTRRSSWMENNAIPDSIIMNMTCRSLEPLMVEFNEPKFEIRSTGIALTSKKTTRILNTINPVAMVFTAMDTARPVRFIVVPQGAKIYWSCTYVKAPCVDKQEAREVINWNWLIQMTRKIDWLT